ncbi:hypothetical protein [Sphingomonas sp.]|uniref:hypothetical protein n=1 Tax=Sphingomonas sp. TaxID=28214 RepID=UPI00286C88C1|nr:hypothetical protein [Sphingomonas sp.]
MSSAPSAQDIARDARWLAQALDPGTGIVRLVAMTPEAYRAASFLDDRLLRGPVNAQALPFAEVADAMPEGVRRDARWIFHIGHVGSTLIARLLGEFAGVLSIREPRILRDLAGMPGEHRRPIIPAIQTLLSRTFAPDETALVKATSFVSEIAAELVPPGERALFLTADPRSYLATILAGESNLKELHAWADKRAQRMADRVHGLSGSRPAELAAAAWACEMTALEVAADVMTNRPVLWANFDRLLDDMATELGRIAEFFAFAAAPERVRAIVGGPLMSRYSKALEYAYSPSLRGQLIDQELTAHGGAIDDALAMLERSAQESPLLARALARS